MKSSIEEKLQLLIEDGKQHGFITYDQFNEMFPEECNSPERIDEIFATLDAHGIEIREDTASGSVGIAEKDELDGVPEKIDDPVRMYLIQMGEIPLLTRAEELLLAKKIEISRQRFQKQIYSMGFSHGLVIKILHDTLNGALPLDKAVKVTPPKNKEELTKEEILQLVRSNVSTLEKLHEENHRDYKEVINERVSKSYRQKIAQRVKTRNNRGGSILFGTLFVQRGDVILTEPESGLCDRVAYLCVS